MSEPEIDAMMAAAADRGIVAPTRFAMRDWLVESAERDANGECRNPMPHENWCSAGLGKCDRQEGHPGEHSTYY